MDETQAITDARRGNGDAFANLVRQYQDIAFRTAYLILGNAPDAEDAAQTGFTKAYFALPSFRDGAPFRPWLLTIVANEARNRRTSLSRHPVVDLEPLAPLLADTTEREPEALALARDRSSHLIEAVNKLRDEDRTVISMRYFLDLNEAEMAAALDCPVGTVKSRLSRAMTRLRSELVEGGPDV
jgi:RNA polymerase sigma-70 factor (ECF subfamily)